MRLYRLFTLLDLLRSQTQPVTAKSLSEKLEVSQRSIYRDISDLQAMGAPIRGEGGVGYVLERGYFLPSLHFDEEELDALLLGLRLVEERSNEDLGKASMRALSKLSSSIGEDMREAWLRTPLKAGPSEVGSLAKGANFYRQIRDAIKHSRVLQIDYLSLSEKTSKRLARPLGMTVFETAWLLTIWCETADDFRHLRLERITHVADANRRFRAESGKTFADALRIEKRKLSKNSKTGND